MKKNGINRREFLKKAVLATTVSLPVIGSIGCYEQGYSDTGTGDGQTDKGFFPAADTRADMAIKNASIVDVKTGAVITDRMILVKDGRILDIINGNSDAAYNADITIDLNGKYIMPGLINAHTHMSMPCSISFFDPNVVPELLPLFYRQAKKNALECIKHGVTTVRDMGAMNNIVEALKKNISEGDIPGPRIITSSVLDVTGSFMNAAFGLAADPLLEYFQYANYAAEAAKSVADAIRDGMGWIKLYHQEKNMAKPMPEFRVMSEKLAAIVCREARRQGIPVAQHVTNINGFMKGINAGVTTFEHMIIERELTADEIKMVTDKGICFIPTVSVGYALCYQTKNDPDWSYGFKKIIAEERNRLLPGMIDEYLVPEYAAAQHKAFDDYSNPEYFDTFELDDPVKLDPDAFIGTLTNGTDNAKALFDAGVKMGCGNDGGMPFLFPGAVGLEMHLLLKHGIAPAEIIKMATINNAEILGLDKDLGSIEKGKIADLVVFSGNPLESLENTFTASCVFQNGKLVYS